MPSDATPAIPLTYATESDSSLARAVAVCHWVAIGMLLSAAYAHIAPLITSILSEPRLTWYTITFREMTAVEVVYTVAHPTSAGITLLAGAFALTRRRYAVRIWMCTLLLELLVGGATTYVWEYMFRLSISRDSGSVQLTINHSQRAVEALTAILTSPALLLLVLFTRRPIVRARWTR